MQSRVSFSATIAAVLFAVSAAGQDTTRVVAQRQQDMKVMAAAAKTIAAMFKVPKTYSPGRR